MWQNGQSSVSRPFCHFVFIKKYQKNVRFWFSHSIYYSMMKFENATIRKGCNRKGYILAKNKLTQDAMDKVKEAWRKLYSNSYDTKDNAVVLNDGLDFKESSSTSVELQLNENKRTNADEICKLFCMPADVLNDKADEHMISQFVQNCLMPLINTIESALDTDLLTEAEKAGHYYFAFDTSELTRGDFASRMNAYAVAYQNNFYQLDEIRAMEDLPPLDFNFIKLGLDAVLVDPKTREIYTPNTGKLEKMNAEHLTDEDICDILEPRGNPYHDDKGRFTSAGGAGGKMSNISLPLKPPKLSHKERTRLEHEIHSDFPMLPPGDKKYPYENRNHFYIFSVNDYGGDYSFWFKYPLNSETQGTVNEIKRRLYNGEF